MEWLHVCSRVAEIDRSVAFYQTLGFEENRRFPAGRETINVFMGLPGDPDRLELTCKQGVEGQDRDTGLDHIALLVDDLDGTLERLAGEGIDPEAPPYRRGEGARGRRVAVVRDPDGYRIELISR